MSHPEDLSCLLFAEQWGRQGRDIFLATFVPTIYGKWESPGGHQSGGHSGELGSRVELALVANGYWCASPEDLRAGEPADCPDQIQDFELAHPASMAVMST